MKKRRWVTNNGSRSLIYLHIIFVVKYRRKAISEAIGADLCLLFGEILKSLNCELIEFGFEGDHVHSLVLINPSISAATLARLLKGRSSYEMRRKYSEELHGSRLGRHFWSPSYCVVSCGGAPLEIIKSYVENQGKERK